MRYDDSGPLAVELIGDQALFMLLLLTKADAIDFALKLVGEAVRRAD